MSRILIVIALIVGLSGCYRNSPEDQVRDFKVCIEGGMTASRTSLGEITCLP